MIRPMSQARLMRLSTDRVEAVLKYGESSEQFVARRVMESATSWEQWERAHSDLMRRIASCNARLQIDELKQTTLRLLHGKALFQQLRRAEVRGERRVRLMAHFRPGRSFEAAMISEHGEYLRKALSFLCTDYLGAEVVGDPAFIDPMQRYEELYGEYFDLYCRSLLGTLEAGGSQSALLPLLKHQLGVQRAAVLDPRGAQAFLKREAALRRQTGDTQRLPSLGRPKRS
jgi:hypothetical protein